MNRNKNMAMKKLFTSNQAQKEQKHIIDIFIPFTHHQKQSQNNISEQQRQSKLKKFLAFINVKRQNDKLISSKKKSVKQPQKEDIVFDQLFAQGNKQFKSDQISKQKKQKFTHVKRIDEKKRHRSLVSRQKYTKQRTQGNIQIHGQKKQLNSIMRNIQNKIRATNSFDIGKTRPSTISKYSGLLEQKRQVRVKSQSLTIQQLCIKQIFGSHMKHIKNKQQKSFRKQKYKTISTINF